VDDHSERQGGKWWPDRGVIRQGPGVAVTLNYWVHPPPKVFKLSGGDEKPEVRHYPYLVSHHSVYNIFQRIYKPCTLNNRRSENPEVVRIKKYFIDKMIHPEVRGSFIFLKLKHPS
jgi:hypothetical protein